MPRLCLPLLHKPQGPNIPPSPQDSLTSECLSSHARQSLNRVVPRARLVAKDEHTSTTTEDPSTNGTSNGVPSDKVVVDPSKGGAVNPKSDKQSKALEVRPGTWIWDGIANMLEVDLFSQAWEVRHGAALCLRELLKLQGKCGGMKGTFSPLPSVYFLNPFQMVRRPKRMTSYTKDGAIIWPQSCSAYPCLTVSVISSLTR